MFNRVSKISKKTLASHTSLAGADLEESAVGGIVEPAETVQYVVESADGIQHTADDRTTTIESGTGSAWLIVTNRRLYVVVGNAPDEAEVSFELGDITRPQMRDGFLSSTVTMATPSGHIEFDPVDADAASEALDYVDRIGSAWAELLDSLAAAREGIEDVRETLEDGGDARTEYQRASSRISKAYHNATHDEAAPTELMEAVIEPVEEDLESLPVGSEFEGIETSVSEARNALDDDDYEAAVAAIVEAYDAIFAERERREDFSQEDLADGSEFAQVSEAADEVARAILDEAEAACHRALDAEGPDDAIAAWEAALDRYRTAIDGGWDGPGGVSVTALRFQVAWVIGNLIDALAERAAKREATGDAAEDGSDEAADHYEAAHEDLVRAQAMASEHPHADASAFADAIDRLDEKVERAEWEWGAPQ